jgi:hypothetical protein
MAIRNRLPRINFRWNPFKTEKQQLIENLHAAVMSGDAAQADACYVDLKAKGYL